MARSSVQKISLVMQEIYDGSLARFLLYPVSFFDFKFSRVLTLVLMGLVQMIMGYVLLAYFFGTDFDLFLPSSIIMGLVAIVPGVLLYFVISFVLEMVAFWAEGVWSLNVILRFTSSFLGGGLMPISMFPEALQQVIKWLPFYAMLGAPTSAFLGKMTSAELAIDLAVATAWLIVLTALARWVWTKGIKQFSGVGM
jgi:ABC-2 type transport system permease protein